MGKNSTVFGPDAKLAIHNAIIQEMPPNYYFPTHMHNTAEIVICKSGASRFFLQNQEVSVEAGEYIVIFPGTLHDFHTPEGTGCTILQLHFHADIFQTALGLEGSDSSMAFFLEVASGRRRLFKSQAHHQLYACVDSIRLELAEKRSAWKKMADLYLLQMVTLISRDLHDSTQSSPAFHNRYLVKCLAYIHEHYSEPLTSAEIAAVGGISTRYLSRLFSDELAISVPDYTNCVRVQKAIDLMMQRPDCPLTDVAIEVGFSSLQYFSKVFKANIEITPSKYFQMYRRSAERS